MKIRIGKSFWPYKVSVLSAKRDAYGDLESIEEHVLELRTGWGVFVYIGMIIVGGLILWLSPL